MLQLMSNLNTMCLFDIIAGCIILSVELQQRVFMI